MGRVGGQRSASKGHSPGTFQRCSGRDQVYYMHKLNSHNRLCASHIVPCPVFPLLTAYLEHQVILGLGSPRECCHQHCSLCGTWQVAFRLQMWIHPTLHTPAGGVLRESFPELQFDQICLRDLLGSLPSSLPLFLPSLPFQWLCSQEKKFWEKYEKRGKSPLPSY